MARQFNARVQRYDRLNYREIEVIRDRSNPLFDYDDSQFVQRYRVSKEIIVELLGILDLRKDTRGGGGHPTIPPLLEVCVALRYFATGTFQLMHGDAKNISQPTLSRIIAKVSRALAQENRRWIVFPTGDGRDIVQQGFRAIAGFPNVIGCIDCTHVRIPCPGGQEAELFRNRKGYFSINVQVIGDHRLMIRDIVARWQGSVHDSRIFENSLICEEFERRVHNGVLLGDSGYGCKRYLLTPVINPDRRPQQRYNRSQIRTRNSVERLFGNWKRKFNCLNYLRLKLETTLTTIVAVACLHNITIIRNVEFIRDDVDIEIDEEVNGDENVEDALAGRVYRQAIIDQYFT
ncbi:putative nuclease HARBI1 [Antedon mediterranea]|uniref:putative nuclease HARBI1 n=1 Tax=Antedon mediterranea TaxID=105859 RepID=UPI003AF59D5E